MSNLKPAAAADVETEMLGLSRDERRLRSPRHKGGGAGERVRKVSAHTHTQSYHPVQGTSDLHLCPGDWASDGRSVTCSSPWFTLRAVRAEESGGWRASDRPLMPSTESQSWVEGTSLSHRTTWPRGSSVEHKSFSSPQVEKENPAAQLLRLVKAEERHRLCNPKSANVKQ